jgi:hypothetical protein
MSEDELPRAGSRLAARGGTSRMTGDRLVRICEGSRVRFPRSTRHGLGELLPAAGKASGDTEETRRSENLRSTDVQFELHIPTVRFWDGQRFVTPFTRYGAGVFLC